MTIVDLAKARAYAQTLRHDDRDTAADWIDDLADEVESQERALTMARAVERAALADAARLGTENEQLHAGLEDLYGRVAEMIAGPLTEDGS